MGSVIFWCKKLLATKSVTVLWTNKEDKECFINNVKRVIYMTKNLKFLNIYSGVRDREVFPVLFNITDNTVRRVTEGQETGVSDISML
jgi:hypothetical protein